MRNPKKYWSEREKFDMPDECYTPEIAIRPLLPYLKKEWLIWDCETWHINPNRVKGSKIPL